MASSPPALDQRRVALLLASTLLTINSGLAIYLSWGDAVSVSSVGACYLSLLLLALRCRKSRHDGDSSRTGGWLLEAAVLFLIVVLALLLAYELVGPAAPPSASALLVAAAGATALGVGGCCAFLLHRRSWSKQPRQQVTMPLVQESTC